jgi:hypothetical protein
MFVKGYTYWAALTKLACGFQLACNLRFSLFLFVC